MWYTSTCVCVWYVDQVIYLPNWATVDLLRIQEVKWSEVAQWCPTLCNPMDCSLPGSSNHGIFQAWILEWVAVSFSRGSSQPKDRTWVSHIIGRRFTIWATREAPWEYRGSLIIITPGEQHTPGLPEPVVTWLLGCDVKCVCYWVPCCKNLKRWFSGHFSA